MTPDRLTEGARHIREITWGYWRSQILFVATRLGLFDLLARQELTAREAAGRLSLSERGTGILLRALAGLGLVVKSGERFTATEVARELLTAGNPCAMRGAVHHCENLMRGWEELEKSVRTGEPCSVQPRTPEELAQRRADFMAAMKSNASVVAAEVYEKAKIADCRRLLDIGCGPGTFAIEFARRNTALRGTLVDIGEVITITTANICNAGLAGRLSTIPGDFREADFGAGRYDAALLSHVIHMYAAAGNENLLGRIREALAPSGRVIIHDYVLCGDTARPAEAAIFAVNMLVGTCGGNCYSDREISGWLTQAGFIEPEIVPLQWGTQLVIGRKS